MTTNEAQGLTAAFIVMMVAVTVAYDVWAITTFGSDATISRVCGMLFTKHPVVFAWVLVGVGIYIGHVHLSAW